ncbi:MAG TPA: helix-turn-helix transcriptional regulator [Flavilitoribacter sp.]|nr:helix-turn-helix transcriptional regulator [Flavilitoribacter sp.]
MGGPKDAPQNEQNGMTKQQIFLADNLRYLRKQQNLSQEELASKVGLNRGNVASYENGTAEPKLCNLLKLADIFGVSMSDMILKDLSRYQHTNGQYPVLCKEKLAKLEFLLQETVTLREFLEGLSKCTEYNKNKLEDDQLSNEVRFMIHCSDQIFEAAVKLLTHNQELLSFFPSDVPFPQSA